MRGHSLYQVAMIVERTQRRTRNETALVTERKTDASGQVDPIVKDLRREGASQHLVGLGGM